MNRDLRSQLGAKLCAIGKLLAECNDDMARDELRLLLVDADALHTAAAELLAVVVTAAREPGEITFPSGNVAIGPERTPAEDRAAQHVIARAG
jgi:hypothetical protein